MARSTSIALASSSWLPRPARPKARRWAPALKSCALRRRHSSTRSSADDIPRALLPRSHSRSRSRSRRTSSHASVVQWPYERVCPTLRSGLLKRLVRHGRSTHCQLGGRGTIQCSQWQRRIATAASPRGTAFLRRLHAHRQLEATPPHPPLLEAALAAVVAAPRLALRTRRATLTVSSSLLGTCTVTPTSLASSATAQALVEEAAARRRRQQQVWLQQGAVTTPAKSTRSAGRPSALHATHPPIHPHSLPPRSHRQQQR